MVLGFGVGLCAPVLFALFVCRFVCRWLRVSFRVSWCLRRRQLVYSGAIWAFGVLAGAWLIGVLWCYVACRSVCWLAVVLLSSVPHQLGVSGFVVSSFVRQGKKRQNEHIHE